MKVKLLKKLRKRAYKKIGMLLNHLTLNLDLRHRKENKVMTQEDKELLLKDLSARLLYGVIMTNKKLKDTYYPLDGNEWQQAYYDDDWDDVPYLRPMSSMTEEEKRELFEVGCEGNIEHPYGLYFKCQDWLNTHHFDYRGFIEKGLAIEAPEGMYNIKKK